MHDKKEKEWYVAIVEYDYGICLHTATSGETFHGYSERARQNRLGNVIAERFGYCPKLFEKLNGFNLNGKFKGKIPLVELIKSLNEMRENNAQGALDNLCKELIQGK